MAMRFCQFAILTCVVVVGCVNRHSPEQSPKSPTLDNNPSAPDKLERGYFPIGVGYRWTYASKGGDTKDAVVFEVVGTQKVGDAECFVVLRTIGEHKIKFYVRVTDGGVWIHQVGEDPYKPAYRQFVFPSKKGDHWNWKGLIGKEEEEYGCENYGLEEVEVPLGKWKAFSVGQLSQASANFWLVEGIGVVKIEGKTWDKHDPTPGPDSPLYFDWQLKEFSRP